ncbi:MAG: DUF2442 domain-containing protein [Bacteroides sp.]|nr:DUF2442 domain-containing protein [Bacteroides sp.]MCM1378849.1 DUF2442 domain-containing protein [Bacteroides sp.]MCM1445466.1 DUF2442 domain-containing protein [Prevotella sp.]
MRQIIGLFAAFLYFCKVTEIDEMNRDDVANIWLTDSGIWIELRDGRKAQERFADYKRLANAGVEMRQHYILSHFGIHWPELDEDLSYEGFFRAR